MSLDGLKHIVEQVPGLKAVKLQGMGEPMLNREIVPMMHYLSSRSIRVYTALNGTVLPPDLDEFMEVVNRIEYSIDSVDPAKYRRIRGADSLDIVLENLCLICSHRKNRSDVEIRMNCVMIDPDEESFEDLFSLASEKRVDGINFNIVQSWTVGDGYHDGELAGYDLEVAEAVIHRLSQMYRVDAVVHTAVRGYSNCKWARIGCYITWDGYVTPCCQRPDPDEINFGNVFTTSFEEIYNSPRYSCFRKKLLNDEAPYECAHCSAYTYRQVENGCTLSCRP